MHDGDGEREGDGEEQGASAGPRNQLQQLSDKMARLRSRVNELQRAVEKLNAEQANVADQLSRATDAVHRVIDVAETTARRSNRPAAPTRESAEPREDG